MDEAKRLVLAHIARYPGIEPEDCFKLLYQGEFGGGHLIDDYGAFKRRLAEELAAFGMSGGRVSGTEAVGGGYWRAYLFGLQSGPAVETLAALCLQSAGRKHGSAEGLREKILMLRKMADEGYLPWPAWAVKEKVAGYLAAGCPALHHSKRYNALYAPHYRIVDADAALFLPVFAALDAALSKKAGVLVGIDGMCGSGKSTLAALLAKVYGCGVLHADHFFLSEEQRSPERLAAPGGNIDYGRMAPVIGQAALGRRFAYRPYSCARARLTRPVTVNGGPLTVVEGAYCMHPAMKAPYDVRIFLHTGAAEQERRILARGGPRLARRFKEEWIPMENTYFSAFAVRQGCDIVINTECLTEGK